jgi:hypothetical protein
VFDAVVENFEVVVAGLLRILASASLNFKDAPLLYDSRLALDIFESRPSLLGLD